jgi:hypothetical protein
MFGISGMQFIPSMEFIQGSPFNIIVPSMALTKLPNTTATIGTSTIPINRVYSESVLTSSGNVGVLNASDAKLKINFRELSSTTERVLKLRPLMYDFVRSGNGEDVSKKPAYQNRVGFIAQEVKELFPDLVTTYKLGEEEDSEELHALDYAGLIPYLTKTIQEQSEIIQRLNEKVEKQQQQITDIQTGVFAATFDIDMPNNAPQPKGVAGIEESNVLYQNVPNPFNSITTINYRLDNNVKNAKICIYNLTGKQLQCYNLPATAGENAIEVRASSLQSGMYLYSLIVDGKLIDTKRMILTE